MDATIYPYWDTTSEYEMLILTVNAIWDWCPKPLIKAWLDYVEIPFGLMLILAHKSGPIQC